MDLQETHASLFLSAFSITTPSSYQKLLTFYSSAVACVAAGPCEWIGNGLLERELLDLVMGEWEKAERFAQTELTEMQENGIAAYLWQTACYPGLLRQVAAAPPIIYVMGNSLSEEAITLAIVGSRRPTYYGEKAARELTGELAERGVTTVSGLARGIDSRVHDETIKKGGVTWAVLGSGVLNLYPQENKTLARRILEKGAVISEFPLHTPPYRGHFPRRNRIIAGLSYGTIVVEGDEKSGSLITARLAAEEGRDVFAVPGPIFSQLSRGPHRLIQSGAALITGVDDIIQALPDALRGRLTQRSLVENSPAGSDASPYTFLLRELESTALPREALCERLKLTAPVLSTLLLELELQGVVRSLPGGLIEKT